MDRRHTAGDGEGIAAAEADAIGQQPRGEFSDAAEEKKEKGKKGANSAEKENALIASSIGIGFF